MSTKRKTIEQVKKEVKEKYNGDIVVLSDRYINNKTKLLVQCNICNEPPRLVSFNKLMTDSKCPSCSKKKRYTLKEIKDRILENAGPDYQIIQYSGRVSDICTMYHSQCKKTFNPHLDRFLDKKKPTRCPHCSTTKNKRKTQKEFEEEIKTKFPNFKVTSKYTSSTEEIDIKCIRCNKVQKKVPNWVLNNNSLSCPICDIENMSSGIIKITNYLKKNNIDYHLEVSFKNFKSDKNKKFSYDIFIKNKNLLIEFDGSQHFIPTKRYTIEKLKLRRKYDILKDNKILLSKKYSLLRISWKEFDFIDEILFDITSNGSTTISKYNLLYISENSENNYNLNKYYEERSTEKILLEDIVSPL